MLNGVGWYLTPTEKKLFYLEKLRKLLVFLENNDEPIKSSDLTSIVTYPGSSFCTGMKNISLLIQTEL